MAPLSAPLRITGVESHPGGKRAKSSSKTFTDAQAASGAARTRSPETARPRTTAATRASAITSLRVWRMLKVPFRCVKRVVACAPMHALAAFAVAAALAAPASAPVEKGSRNRPERLEWFRDLGFGM